MVENEVRSIRVTAAMSDVAIGRIENRLGCCAGRSSSIFTVERYNLGGLAAGSSP